MKFKKTWFLLSALCVSGTAAAVADLNTGLMAYYPFNGNAKDLSGNGNNGAVNGGVSPTTDRNGNANSAYLFNGDGYVSVPNAASLNPVDQMTIALWIRIDQLSSNNWSAIIYKGAQATYDGCQAWRDYVVWLNPLSTSANLGLEVSGDSSCTHGAGSKSLASSVGKWHFFSAVVDRKTTHTLQIYMDGILQSKVADSYTRFSTDANPLYIGSDGGANYIPFKGAMDEVRLYNRALSQSEIQQLYRVSQQVSGSVGGYAAINVTCANKSSGQTISFSSNNAATSTWNCEKKGLVVKPGDKVDVTLSGFAH